MESNSILQMVIQKTIDGLVYLATDLLLPTMVIVFFSALILRSLIYFTITREEWFAKEFEKRVHQFLLKHSKSDISFYITMKLLLERTYYELFEVRAIMKRRNPDYIMSWSDRVFLVQHGCAILVKETLSQIKYLKHNSFQPKLLEISKFVFQRNPCFSRVFGVVPASLTNDILNILPGLFIVGGIFGTFLGIMKALPELSNMDLNNIEATKATMDQFLLKISFSMSTSIIGIIVSVLMTIVNTLLSPEKLFMEIVERYENSLDVVWNRSNTNDFDVSMEEFDEHKDPLIALAQNALRKELKQEKKFIDKSDLRASAMKENVDIEDHQTSTGFQNFSQNSTSMPPQTPPTPHYDNKDENSPPKSPFDDINKKAS